MLQQCFLSALILLGAASLRAEPQTAAPEHASGVTFAPGKLGRAAQLNEKSRIYFDSSVLNTAGGTADLWIFPTAETPEGKQNFLLSSGNNNPAWFFWGFDDKANNFLSRSRKDAKTFSHYSSIRIPYSFPVNEWTHVALVWCNVAPQESLVQLYVNGKAVIEKFDQTLGPANSGPVGIGCSTASAGAPAFTGLIDELRISNAPRSPQEIMDNYQAVKNGKSLPADESTLLYLDFEDTLNGRKNAAPLPLEELNKRGEKLLDLIVGE